MKISDFALQTQQTTNGRLAAMMTASGVMEIVFKFGEMTRTAGMYVKPKTETKVDKSKQIKSPCHLTLRAPIFC